MTKDIQTKHPHFIELDKLDKAAVRGLYANDFTQCLKVTKATLQMYMEHCLQEGGLFYDLFKKFATFTAHFVVNEALERDNDARHIQIARYYSSMREYPPQIFIQDNGYNYEPSSLGGLTEGYNARDKNHTQVIRFMDVLEIPIDIVCASTNEQEIEDMIAFVTLAFGQFQKLTCGHYLSPPKNQHGIYYQVRIPLTFSVGSKSHAALHGDPRLQLWQATISMTVEFENSSFAQYKAKESYVPSNKTTSLNIPDKVLFNKKTYFTVSHIPYPIRVYSDNSKVAVVQPSKTAYVLWPKKLGTCKILVAKGQPNTGHSIVTSKDVTIVAR
jgi:hypothetical protein